MAHPPPIIGELVVVALKAENLEHQAPVKQDPFCLFRIGDLVKRTKTDHGGGLYPIWDDQVNIPVTVGYHQMHVQIFDKDTMPNNLMGEAVVDITKALREKEHDGYFPLQYRGKQNCGDIYLELTFYSTKNVAVRPQQQVRYVTGVQGYPQQPYQRPPPSQHGPPPSQHGPPPSQHGPPPSQHGPPPSQHGPPPTQHRPPPQHLQPPQHQPLHIQQPVHHSPAQHLQPPQHRPLPQRPPPQQHQHHPPPQQLHRPPPMQQRPPPPQMQRPPQNRPPQSMPPPMNRPHFPRPSTSMGTQNYSSTMPPAQPLLSAPYNPNIPSRPPVNYPPYPAGFQEQRPTYPTRPNYNQRPYPPY